MVQPKLFLSCAWEHRKLWDTDMALRTGSQPGCEQLPFMNRGCTSTDCSDSEEK